MPPLGLRLSFLLPADISELLHSITLLAHLTSDTIIQGSATSLRAPPEPADCEYQGGGEAPENRENKRCLNTCLSCLQL